MYLLIRTVSNINLVKSCCLPGNRKFFKNFYNCLLVILILNFLNPHSTVSAQKISFFTPDSSFNNKRFIAMAVGTTSIYAASMTGLYVLWYKDTNLTSLHSFNDNGEWLLMDKVGHVGSAYYVGKMGISLLNWTGLSRKKAIWYGGLMGAFFQTSIELFDGISPLWGFSWGDVAANAAGSALLISQQLVWNEQRIQMKLSFRPTKFSGISPELLGNSFVETLFKDYNGQTYWLSANISDFLPETSKFPKWLSVSVGYGAEGMTGGFSNDGHPKYDYKRFRQIYVSPDIDLAKIKTRSKFFQTVLYSFGFIKIPMPGIEFQVPGKVRLLPFAF